VLGLSNDFRIGLMVIYLYYNQKTFQI